MRVESIEMNLYFDLKPIEINIKNLIYSISEFNKYSPLNYVVLIIIFLMIKREIGDIFIPIYQSNLKMHVISPRFTGINHTNL